MKQHLPMEFATDNEAPRSTLDGETENKKKAGSRSAIVGLRVRSNSNHGKPPGSVSWVSNALNDPMEAFDYFYKIIVIGDEAVGKTNFLLRIAKNFYDPNPR